MAVIALKEACSRGSRSNKVPSQRASIDNVGSRDSFTTWQPRNRAVRCSRRPEHSVQVGQKEREVRFIEARAAQGAGTRWKLANTPRAATAAAGES